jgi:hypothetical protein
MNTAITQQPSLPNNNAVQQGESVNIPDDLLYLHTLSEVRVYQQLDEYDGKTDVYIVICPSTIYSIMSSYMF